MHALRTLLDALFPPTEEARLVRSASPSTLRAHYHPHDARGATALLSFREPLVRALIHEAKFRRNQRAIELLGTLLAHHLADHAAHLVPVPLSRERLRERGYNQVTLIARAAGMPVAEHLLVRVRHTSPQTSLTRPQRLTNLRHAFALQPHTLALHTPLILLDDVTTTGATLREAVETLKESGFTEVRTLALAH